MKVDQKGHTTIIKNTQGDTAAFHQKLVQEYHTYQKQNLILDLNADKELTMKDLLLFSDVMKSHKKMKKSLVLVAESIDYNSVPQSIIVVPTVLEAQDLIEMDEIERDLGF